MSDNSDSEYESDDDEDYVPDEESSEEDIEDKEEIVPKRKKAKQPARRTRKRGIRLDEDSEPDDDQEEVCNPEEATKEESDDAEEKKEDLKYDERADKLWAAFKRDTATVRPSVASSNVTQNAEQRVGSKIGNKEAASSSVVTHKEKDAFKKVEVTEIFDFAGEEVKVVKSVDASSLTSAAHSDEGKTAVKPKGTLLMKRPSGGLGSVLGKIGKKPKLSTLEKSKLDWNSFKRDEGIEDELKTSNRDGYLEKQAFLSRVDHKQFEIERDIRQGVRKK